MARQSIGAQSDPGHSHQSPRLRSSCAIAIARRKSRRTGIIFTPLELFPLHEVIEQIDFVGLEILSPLQIMHMGVSLQVRIEVQVGRVVHLANRAVYPWPMI